MLVAGLAFVLVFALRVGSRGGRSTSCDLVEMEPHQNVSLIRDFVSSDYTMIANFAGFIKFVHFVDEKIEKVSYLPLELTGIRYTSFSQHELLVLETACANLELLTYQDTKTKMTIVKQVLVFWHKPYRTYNHCYVSTQKFDTPASSHYACHKQEYYKCVQSTDVDVWDEISLVANQLEFEVNGDTKHLRRGQFSTAAKECTR